jgi:predicted dinucleotide-binding enzyme
LTIGHTTSAAEEIAKAVPGARVVKAFNTVFASVLADGPTLNGATVPVFVAADDAAARDAVAQLAKSAGFDVIDAGALKNARYLEPLAGLNIYLGYGAGLGTSIAPTFLRNA